MFSLSGKVDLSGWITVFAAFNKDGEWQGGDVIDFSDIPSRAISVPVSIDDNGRQYDAHMLAGQFAFDGEGTSIQP